MLVEHYGRQTVAGPTPTATTEPLSRFSAGSRQAPAEPDNDNAFNQANAQGATPGRLPMNSLNAFGVAVPAYRALRTSRYLYVEYDYGARQLFDVVADPNETNDIINSTSPVTVHALSRHLHALEQCRAQSCRRLENQPLPT